MACCVAVAQNAFPEAPEAPGPETLTEAQTSCCRVIVETRDRSEGTPGAAEIPWELAYRCCPFLDMQGTFSPTCTPWGPPTPPFLDASLLDGRWQEVA
jgi:hypothetical protein